MVQRRKLLGEYLDLADLPLNIISTSHAIGDQIFRIFFRQLFGDNYSFP